MAEVALQVHQDLHQLGCPSQIALPLEGESEVPTRVGLPPSVADRLADAELLFVELNGTVRLAEGRISDSQVAEVVTLSSAVANLAIDVERSLMEADGATKLAEVRVGEA